MKNVKLISYVQTAGNSKLMNVVPFRKGRVSSDVNGQLGFLHLLMAVHLTCLPMHSGGLS